MANYEEWIVRAKSSLELAQAKIIKHIHYEDLCYQAQQAIEKALKGLLIYFGIEPEFTHNIEVLLNKLKQFTDIPANIKLTTHVTVYAVQTRYPGEYDEITKDEYINAIKISKECLEWVEKIIETKEKEKIENNKSKTST